MARFTPKKLVLNNINNGNEYVNGDGIGAETINAPIEAMAYTQAMATTQPDSSEAGNVGTPSVEIIEVNNLPKLKFRNLKGQKGDKGDKGDTGATVGSNPNLLINSNFAINQRGQSSYTTTGSRVYTVDRWFIWSYAGNYNVSTKTISATGTGNTIFSQVIENLDGGIYTISAKVDGIVYTASGTVTQSVNIITNFTNGYMRFVYDSSRQVYRFDIGVSSGKSVVVDWVKLEIGDTATGYTPPLIAEELPKCQRYYQKIKTLYGSNIFGFGTLRNATSSRFEIPLLNALRTTPTIEVNELDILNFVSGLIVTTGITVSILALTNNAIYIQCTTSNSIGNNGENLQIYGNTANGYISLDAEIY